MKTITHTRGSLETSDVVADSIGALDDALRESNLMARLEIPVVSSGGAPITVEVVLGRRETISTERRNVRATDPVDAAAFDPFDFDQL